MFGQHPFSRYSEHDVRENIIRPLLVQLGYQPEMVWTKLPLKYDRLFLGRKKGSKKDRALRGEADYIMDVDGRLRWVIEAKRPGEISDDDREQAFSYAMHPQVRAIIFGVVSGTHFEFFHTFHKPENGPWLEFRYDDLPAQFQRLSNLVSPAAMVRNNPDFVLDAGLPLAPGLRSFAKVESGKMTYTKLPSFGEDVVGWSVHFLEGSVVRRKEGGILALVKPSFHKPSLTAFMEAVKATEMELVTSDGVISSDATKPSVFSQSRDLEIAKGTPVPFFKTDSTIPAQVSVRSQMTAEVTGYLRETTFIGKLVGRSTVPVVNIPFEVCADVEFTLR